MREPSVTSKKETFQTLIEHVIPVHIFVKARKDMAGTVIESDSYGTDFMLQSPWRSVARSPCDVTGKIECSLVDLGAITKLTLGL